MQLSVMEVTEKFTFTISERTESLERASHIQHKQAGIRYTTEKQKETNKVPKRSQEPNLREKNINQAKQNKTKSSHECLFYGRL